MRYPVLTIALVWALSLPAAAGPRASVAVLDFDAKEMAGADYGPKVADLTTTVLSASGDLVVVERARLKDILAEQSLSLSGVINPDEAIAVGKITGARLIICGRVFPIEGKVVYLAKVISTETSRMVGVMHQAEPETSLSEASLALAAKLGERIDKQRDGLLPEWKKSDPAEELVKLLKDKELPTLAFVIPEQHISRPVIDPAAETELMTIAKKVGFEIVDVDEKGLSKWAHQTLTSKNVEVPARLAQVDVIIAGEGFSETGATYEQLRTCRARLEATAIDAATGKVLVIERAEAAGVDLGDAIAGKKALAAAARKIAVKLLSGAVSK